MVLWPSRTPAPGETAAPQRFVIHFFGWKKLSGLAQG